MKTINSNGDPDYKYTGWEVKTRPDIDLHQNQIKVIRPFDGWTQEEKNVFVKAFINGLFGENGLRLFKDE